MDEDSLPIRRAPGAALRSLRESKGLTLEAAAAATHVKLRFLKALEQEDTGALLNKAYAKSFLKAYARFLEAEADLVEDYRVLLQDSGSSPPSKMPVRPEQRRSRGRWIVPLVIGLVGSVALLLLRPPREAHGPPAASADVDSMAPFVDDPVLAADTLAIIPAGTPMLPPDTLASLQIVAVESTWVEASSDGHVRLHELLMPGEVRIIDAVYRYRLTLGNAGGVELTLNGERLPPPGPRGMVIRNMVIDASRETVEP